ncbi:hypothetical protein ARMGADRAFT_1082001 [Armillaria gallica]|uniref:Zn(2)-C6 fungal-type domain-containing protein n=1 Tax=Armillaria gallica TaxID=47427 RepID=A0A2H3DQ55_ARMGA|nr:hypothetical protein ARMGADRAFT_1082001 [Armillaria gallica]
MAEPTDPAKLAKVQAQDMYNAAAVAIEDLLDDFPNPTWNSTRMDTWLIDAVSHLTTCEQYWSPAGVTSKAWYKLEYSLITRVPDLSMDLVAFARTEFNALVERVLDYELDVSRQDTATTGSRVVTPTPLPAPSKTTVPMPPPPKLMTLLLQKETTPAPQKQQSSAPVTPQPSMPKFTAPSTAQRTGQSSTIQGKMTPQSTVDVNTGPSDSTEAFQKDWSSPLHSKPTQRFPVGPPVQATRPEVPTTASSRAFAIDAASRPTVIRGPDPNLDDEEEQIQEDLVTGGTALFEDDGLANNISNLDNDAVPPQDEQMDFDKDEPSSDDKEPSPPPMNLAHRLRQEPRILFVFDEVTGDFVKSHPTIFLPRLAVPPALSQDLRCSARLRGSPVNPDAAYLKAIQGSKVDVKKKKNKDAKGKDRATEAKAPHKCARAEDNATQLKDKPASKKPKLKETIIIDEDEPAVATKVVCRHGPGLSRPPPVTLGVSGGGFGEKVPSSANVVENRIKSIGVLVVDRDFGNFVEVDKSYWSKEVAPFVGERYTTACDHCRRLGTQCRKLLTHTVKCVRCHYSKLPCKVNGVAVLNPVEHYRPKGYDAVNTFEGALNAIETNNATISELTQQYLAGLSIFAHTDSIRAQASRLRGCLYPIEDEDKEDGKEDDDGEAPEDVAEGVAGPSKQKKKGKSG